MHVFFFSEVAVAGATGVAGAAGVDVLRAGGRRGLLNGKRFLTVSADGQKKIHRHFSTYITSLVF